MSRRIARRQVPTWVAATVLVLVATAVLTGRYLALTQAPPDAAPKTAPPDDVVLPPGSYPQTPLAAGEPFPPFEAGGWVNGEPKQPGDGSAELTVVDVWADWCPVCRQTAPGLVEAHRQFAEAGVAFVSLTSLGRAEVASFAEAYSVPWPCGYGADSRSVARLGVYSTERMSGLYHPGMATFHTGHEITPTLFLIGADGRVLWNDRQARPRHLKDAAGVLREITDQIERALAARAGTKYERGGGSGSP